MRANALENEVARRKGGMPEQLNFVRGREPPDPKGVSPRIRRKEHGFREVISEAMACIIVAGSQVSSGLTASLRA